MVAVLRLAEQNPHLTARDVERVIDTILGTLGDALAAGDRVELRDFGAFSTRARSARTRRNPRTGAAMEVDGKRTVRFKPGKAMHVRLNGPVRAPHIAPAPSARDLHP